MNLNPAEWTRAQELLLRLVDVLGPIAQKQNSLFGTQRLFFPFSHSSLFTDAGPIRFGARLLTDLTDAKKEVEEWIGKLPIHAAEEAIEPTAETNSKPFSSPAETSNVEKSGVAPTALSPSKKELDSSLIKELRKSSSTPEKNSPVETQAQKLVEQVRSAILSLSSSSFLVDPKAGPLRDALKRLKPLIDQLIDAVSQEGMHLAGDGLPQAARFKAAPSERETLLKRLIPFPQENRETQENRRSASSHSPRLIDLQTERGEGAGKKPDTHSSKTYSTPPYSLLDRPKEKTAEAEKPHFDRNGERTSIPAAPYLSSTSASLSSRKPKKKRKSFWLREDEASQKRDDTP